MILEIGYGFILFSGIICLSTVLYNLVRQYSFVSVNCWFCNANLRIPFKSRNEWFCEQCHQFNGFKKDGDYSRHIPEQFDETLNQKYARPSFSRAEYVFNSNGLCSICNANQELKIKQLALYVPFREENFDDEIEIFRNKLEKSYKLCENCENFVGRKLQSTSDAGNLRNKSRGEQLVTTRRSIFKIYFSKSKLRVLFMVVIGTLAAYIFKKTESPTESDEHLSINCSFEYFVRAASRLCCDFLLDYTFALSTAFLPYVFLNSLHSVIGSLLVLFFSMISDDLVPFWKVFTICAVAIAITIRYVTSERRKVRCALEKLSHNIHNGLTLSECDKNEENGCERRSGFSKLKSSTGMFSSGPLCGQFSHMNLGKSGKSASHSLAQPSPHAFKCDRLLVQPSKLKLDEFDYTDTLRTSPTVSSGYESFCGGFIKKNVDSVSEFDSISQVNVATRNHLLSNVSKIHSSPSFTPSSSHFHSTDALSLSAAERYYGAMPMYSSATMSSSPSLNLSADKSHSQLQVNAGIPLFQIVFYSVACFILGFTFQLCVREFFV